MQTLVICIDRDNDLGDKAGVRTPLIGREKNVEAAVRLASADPEDSDVNTIFGGIKVLDDLKKRGIDAEIISFAGDRKVGVLSDQKIAQQIEEVLRNSDAKSAIFVSDGAEDETLVPIVQSRIKIDSVKRIVVKQSSNLESTYYILKHAINDPKISQTFFIPIGLAAIIYAFFLLIQYPSGAIIGILVAVGFYMLYRGLNLDETFVVFKEKAKQSIYTGQITFITYLMAVLIAIIATIRGAVELWGYYTTGGSWYYGFVTLMTAFVNVTVWWYVSSVLFAYAGKIIEIKMDNKFNKRKLSPVFFTISVGLLLWGASKYILAISSLATESTTEFILPYFIYTVVSAIILGFAGIYIATTHVEKKRDEP